MNIWFITKYGKVKESGVVPARSYCLVRSLNKLGHNSVLMMSDSTRNTLVPSFVGKSTIIDDGEVKVCWIRAPKYRKAKSVQRIVSWIGFEYNLMTMDKSLLIKPDVIIASSLSLLTIVSALLLKFKYNAKVIFEVRDIWPLTLTENSNWSRFNPFIILLRLIELCGYRFSDAIVGTMPNLEEHVRQSRRVRTPVFCVPMGISEEILRSDSRVAPRGFQELLDRKKFNVLYCGSFGYDNALEYFFKLVEAAQIYEHIAFHAVGKGDLKSQYQREYGHLPNLTFHPPVESSEVTATLKCADLLFVAAHDSRVLSYGQSLNKLIEYMFSGRPIFACYAGHQSMINEAGCGIFVHPKDLNGQLERLHYLSSMGKSSLSDMGERGRLWVVENRDYGKLARRYERILRETL